MKSSRFLAAVFILAFFLPIPMMLFSPKQTISFAEKRMLEEVPAFSLELKTMEAFPSKFESYLQDHFGFRTPLIVLHNYIKVKMLNKSPNSKIILGKDGWLFLTEDGVIEDYRGLSHPEQLQLEAIRIHLKNKHDFLKNKGIKYLYVIAPNKHTVYPEFMPDHINRVNNRSRCDIVMQHLAGHSDAPILDLRPFFLEKKHHHDRLYYMTDAHWDKKGAFLAYGEIMNRVKSYFHDIPILDTHAVKKQYIPSKGLDSANMLYLSEYFEETIPVITPETHAAKEVGGLKNGIQLEFIPQRQIETINPKATYTAVVFRDSFCTNLIPYLSESFQKVIYIWSPFQKEKMDKILESFKPDIVIEEVTERLVGNYYKNHTSYNILGNEMLKNGSTLKAVQYFQNALKLLPNSPSSHYNLGYAYLQAGKLNLAVKYLNQVLKLNPMHKKAKHSLTMALTKLFFKYSEIKEHEKSVLILNRLVVLEPENTDHYYNLACAFSRLNMPANSIKWLKKAISRGYDNWDLIKSDHDLDSIRNTDAFKKILSQER